MVYDWMIKTANKPPQPYTTQAEPVERPPAAARPSTSTTSGAVPKQQQAERTGTATTQQSQGRPEEAEVPVSGAEDDIAAETEHDKFVKEIKGKVSNDIT